MKTQDIMKTENQIHELLESLNQIAGMAETGRDTVDDIVGSRIGSGGQPSRQIDSAAAVTRGAFIAIETLARVTLARHVLITNTSTCAD